PLLQRDHSLAPGGRRARAASRICGLLEVETPGPVNATARLLVRGRYLWAMSARTRILLVAAAAALVLAAPGAARAAPDLQLTDVVPGSPSPFDHPVYVTSPPDDPSRIFVVQQGGKVQMVKNNAITTFLDLTNKVEDTSEEGLLSIAF